jgi:para-aminobenzoate synthetase component I
MENLTDVIGHISRVHEEVISLDESFESMAAKFSHVEGTVVLLSGADLDCARYHLMGIRPWLSFKGRGHGVTVTIDGTPYQFQKDPFQVLHDILQRCQIFTENVSLPIVAGLMGYLSYDLKDRLEVLPKTSIDDLGLPDICFYAPSILVVHDKEQNETRLLIPQRSESQVIQDRAFFFKTLYDSSSTFGAYSSTSAEGRSNFERTQYLKSIEKIIDYIAAGHVYQVNLSQRFQMDFSGDAYTLFADLFKANPAPFFAYIHAGDHHIVSTSPERFLQQIGRKVETRPIKGTRPRGGTPEEDQALREELSYSKKDDAELSMIVDLHRNDLGKVCSAGSVKVSEHKKVEAYQNVYHLVSTVEGRLASGKDVIDLIRATFPGGSITGCPKIRAMEIIDELEPHRRHIYTGSIGYISFHDTMDLSIAIRTATVLNDQILFSVGGGIVYDSNPVDEYDETLHKGRTIMERCSGAAKDTEPSFVVWQNGAFKSADTAGVSISNLGLMYGYGFFETIRATGGSPKNMSAHLARFSKTWQHLLSTDPPDLSWGEILHQVLSQNGLQDRVAAIKLMVAAGDRTESPFNHQIVITARPYTHRLAQINQKGLHLVQYPEPRQTPLADYKTTNYLYYYWAGKWAHRKGADEALILNPDGSISETNSANILLIKGNLTVLPRSPHVLPGVMQKQVCKLLSTWGFTIKEETVLPSSLFDADQVFVTNALMGAVPVLSLNEKKVPFQNDLYLRINSHVL